MPTNTSTSTNTNTNVNNTPLSLFFAQYRAQGFHHRPSESASAEFERLCKFLNFPDDLDERREIYKYREARRRYNDALTQQFNQVYGTGINDYRAWHALCSRIGIDPIPETVGECKKIMRKTHVNLVDLTQATEADSRVEVFATEGELVAYTRSTDKIFPRENIHSGDILKFLLRRIFASSVPRAHGRARRWH